MKVLMIFLYGLSAIGAISAFVALASRKGSFLMAWLSLIPFVTLIMLIFDEDRVWIWAVLGLWACLLINGAAGSALRIYK